ncbi:MAG: hypothetical protein JWR58_773 [Pseudonocardia sp.]|jgi:uncharacterized protein (DUF2267 family)|nr:hypothetical protein [Pseudonocardia sp.]
MAEWDTERFTSLVAGLAGTDRDGAERAAAAVLNTLAEHLTRGEAADVLERLPAELQPHLHTPGPAQRFGVAEFVRRVAAREGVDLATAERHAAAVLTVLGQAIGEDEFADLTAQLPREYGPLLSGRSVVDPAEAFVARVADRAGMTVEEADRLTSAVLETLAQRIAPGEAADLAARLPLALQEPLRRGAAAPRHRMGVADFVIRVAERAGLDLTRAVRGIPAVFRVLRDDVGEEFVDVTVQLPEEYRTLVDSRRSRSSP